MQSTRGWEMQAMLPTTISFSFETVTLRAESVSAIAPGLAEERAPSPPLGKAGRPAMLMLAGLVKIAPAVPLVALTDPWQMLISAAVLVPLYCDGVLLLLAGAPRFASLWGAQLWQQKLGAKDLADLPDLFF
jgi:hypothetical protein